MSRTTRGAPPPRPWGCSARTARLTVNGDDLHNRTAITFAATLALLVALPAAAQAKKKPVPRAVPVVAPLMLPPAPSEQLAAAALIFFGDYACEFGKAMRVSHNPRFEGYVDLLLDKQLFTLKPVLSHTGALRLEDVRGRLLLVQIPVKSMVMDVKIGQRLVDDCVHETQSENRRLLAAAPAVPGLGIDPEKAAADAAAEAAQAAQAAQAASAAATALAVAPLPCVVVVPTPAASAAASAPEQPASAAASAPERPASAPTTASPPAPAASGAGAGTVGPAPQCKNTPLLLGGLTPVHPLGNVRCSLIPAAHHLSGRALTTLHIVEAWRCQTTSGRSASGSSTV